MNKYDIIDMLDWMSTKYQPLGYEWLDVENNKRYTSEEMIELYLKEKE